MDVSSRVATALLAGREDLQEERVAFLVTPGFPWVAAQWGIWRAGGVAVPLPLNSVRPELEYLLDDAAASILLFDAAAAALLTPIAADREIRALSYEQIPAGHSSCLPDIAGERRAMILYTSGTTSRPKGVVTTHANITAQIASLVEAWEWSADDRILLCLPLHHVHGIINVVCCALWSGATCLMLPRFDANAVWDQIAGSEVTLFMAVPTVYAKLIAAWDAASPERRAALSEACGGLRLMVSGSAALPMNTLQRWKEISGHTLLERYGMTEIGMALSNPLRGERVPGSVGTPLPKVEVQLVGEGGKPVAPGTPGEIEVRGPSVFAEYWRKPDATHNAFRNGWFRTGDTGVMENGVYRIVGRTSIDILKTGGHKVSALEIEEVLRKHHAVAECAVVGVPDPEWGERVAVAVVLNDGHALDLPSLRTWAKELLAAHKVPSRLLALDALPRNAMGKVKKPTVTALFQTAVTDGIEVGPPPAVVTIRRAQVEDVAGVAECLESAFEPFRSLYTRAAFRDTVPSPAELRERVVHMKVHVAITADGDVIGTLASSVEGEDGHLRGMAVRPAWQGRHIAEQLLRVAENDLLAAGCARITLDTTLPLQRAVRFYQRNGFIPSGRITDFFGMPLYEYVKPLIP
jgi:malonyl-CoA/methylmalonyl-CoA synthetase